MQLNDLLVTEAISPKGVLVFRHRPIEPELRKVLPWLAAEKPDVYNGYQQAQLPKIEKAMTQAKYVASFIGQEARKALFVGLYKVGKWRLVSQKEYWRSANATQQIYASPSYNEFLQTWRRRM